MQIVQLAADIRCSNEIANNIHAFNRMLKQSGFSTCVCAGAFLPDEHNDLVRPFSVLNYLSSDDVAILHMGNDGADFVYDFCQLNCRKILFYYGIIPPAYMKKHDASYSRFLECSQRQVRRVINYVDRCFVDSARSELELRSLGCTCPIDIVPPTVDAERFRRKPNSEIVKTYKRHKGSILLSAGEVAPQRCYEDTIRAFYCYQRMFDSEAELIILGSYRNADPYFRSLLAYQKELGVSRTLFTGAVSDESASAYYKIADAYLTQSDYEETYMPLVGAMTLGVPSVAYSSPLVEEILGGAGFLLNEKSPQLTACLINHIITHRDVRLALEARAKKAVLKYDRDHSGNIFLSRLRAFLEDS